MNKLNIMNGVGLPLKIDDIDFLQTSVADAFKGALASREVSGQATYIISGCTVTLNAGNYDVSAGWVCFQGEPVKVDAHSVLVADAQYWNLQETPLKTRAYQTGPTYQIWKQRRVYLSPNNTAGAVAFAAMKRLSTGWMNLTPLTNGWIANVANPPQYRLEEGNRIVMRGVIEAAGATNDVFAALGVGYVPDDDQVLPVAASGAGFAIEVFTATSGGNLSCSRGGGYNYYNLAAIAYYIS